MIVVENDADPSGARGKASMKKVVFSSHLINLAMNESIE